MRAATSSFRARDLRVHELLHDVDLHDVWTVDLPGDPGGTTLRDLPGFVPGPDDPDLSRAVRALFALRHWLGAAFKWDVSVPRQDAESYANRVSARDRTRSLRPPGSPGPGPFRWVFELPDEALLETRNATVHAFLSSSLEPLPDGQRLWLAIFVKPVSRWTKWYMRAIDPFRRWIVYPTLLRRLQRQWHATRARAR